MKIALTILHYWPYFKRSGRFVTGLAHFLSRRGHEVTVITTKPGRSRMVKRDGININYSGVRHHYFLPSKYQNHAYILYCLSSILRGKFDIIQSLYYIDCFAVSLKMSFTNTKSIYYIPGNPFHLGSSLDAYMFRRAIRSAEQIVVPSEFVQKSLKKEYGLEGIIIPPGVDTGYFQPVSEKDLDRPKILCMAELRVQRKRVPLLIRAFEKFRESVPGAILQLSGMIHNNELQVFLESARTDIRDSIQFLGVGKEEDIPLLYANAAMTVLPSLREAFGMVLIESLSAGTPVVGTRDGGIPEIIDDQGVGVLFEGEGEQAEESLCRAMLQCLELAKNPDTASYCRQHSRRYDWSVVGEKLEKLYQDILGIN
jgi:glycosyltransferase involved in cell wall biosynthesis